MAERKPRPYFTLIERVEGGPWTIQFGDYDRGTVKSELDDMKRSRRDAGEPLPAFTILATLDARQATINAAVARMNGTA